MTIHIKPLPFAVCLLAAASVGSGLRAVEFNKDVKVTPLLKTTQSWDGQQLAYPQGQAEVTALTIEIAPGGQTGWHQHPVPSFAHMLQGEIDVRLKNGVKHHFKAGDTFAEVTNTLHNGRNTGKVPVKILVFYAGAVGKSLTVMEPNAANGVSTHAVKTHAVPST